ncbi:DUF4241 domain-containing protein [Calothrix sp. NIES-2098]|uniref:DUF4241 domain-containing protein n=1 Tax=Calothrix sp. NIES-2098 TaxID=1954171 RepID=UPI000B5F6050|nr:hypothetical protein NIES2098_44610 [Calothrix sp. NIES-2098]
MNNFDFLSYFQNEQNLSNEKLSDIIFTPYKVGELVLTSGKLVACDPLTLADSEPFTANFAPGRYPVILSIAHIQKNNSRRVAYAMLCLSEQTPVAWEMATHPTEDLSSLQEDEFFGYGVDSGTGCFMDADTAQIMDDSIYSKNTYQESLFYKLNCELEKNYSPTWDWADMCVDNSNQANVIAFSSGWGDGIYPTYFGFNIENKIVKVITDFHL